MKMMRRMLRDANTCVYKYTYSYIYIYVYIYVFIYKNLHILNKNDAKSALWGKYVRPVAYCFVDGLPRCTLDEIICILGKKHTQYHCPFLFLDHRRHSKKQYGYSKKTHTLDPDSVGLALVGYVCVCVDMCVGVRVCVCACVAVWQCGHMRVSMCVTNSFIHINTNAHSHICTQLHIDPPTNTNTHRPTDSQIHRPTDTQTHRCMDARNRTVTFTQMQTHTDIFPRTQTHTNT